MGMESPDYYEDDDIDEDIDKVQENENPDESDPDSGKDQEMTLLSETTTDTDINTIGDASDVKKLDEAVESLKQTETGRELAKAISDNDVSVQFEKLDPGVAAQYSPRDNEISISEDYRDRDPSVIAAHMAHEGTHAQWYGQGLDNSIDQEYHAFKNEKEVWDATKGDNTDDQCDWVSNELMDQDEADAKMLLRQMRSYRNLPEYS